MTKPPMKTQRDRDAERKAEMDDAFDEESQQRSTLLPGTPVPDADVNAPHGTTEPPPHPFEGEPVAARAPEPMVRMQPPAPPTSIPPATAPAPVSVDGVFFLHATAGSRTHLTKIEYDALVVALEKMRKGKA